LSIAKREVRRSSCKTFTCTPITLDSGVVGSLLNHVQDLLKADSDLVLLWLYVERENEAAIATCLRLGFEDLGY